MRKTNGTTSKTCFVVPWALFAGVLISFAACCVAGWQTTQKHQLTRFTRFSQRLSPETSFYPTASHVYRLGLARTKKERINVIVGGSSILNGAGQAAHEVWTDKLTQLLGPDYRVLNLGFRSAQAGEFGAIGAEMLLDRRRLIFVSTVPAVSFGGQPDGIHFRYFFWDAWYKGLIDRDLPDRAARLANLGKERASDPKFPEVLRGARLNSWLFYNDWWNTLLYTKGGTMWNPVTHLESFSPRIKLEDLEPGVPPGGRDIEFFRRELASSGFNGLVHKFPMKKNASDVWVPDSVWHAALRKVARDSFPNEILRQRTIVVIQKPHPVVFEGLTEDELRCWSSVLDLTSNVVRELGMRPLEMAEMTGPEDYTDLIHFAGKGGEKLAIQLAPAIREMATELGYTEPGAESRSSSSKNKKK